MIVKEIDLLSLVEEALVKYGTPRDVASVQARSLAEGDLRGHPSHGLQRLPRLVDRIVAGLIDPEATPALNWRSPSFADVDGRHGLGPVVGFAVLDELVQQSAKTGVAVGAVRNANHLGMLAPYVERVVAAGQIGVVLTTAEALVHPWGGRRAMLGTNPIGIGVPSDTNPFVLDMSTAAVSQGKVLAHARDGMALEPGCVVDVEGKPTRDASRADAISPFGGAKGYGLGLGLELVVAALTGTETGQRVFGTLDATSPSTKGDVFITLHPHSVQGEGFGTRMGAFLDEVRESPPAHGDERIDIPGDRARRVRAERLAHGIPIEDAVWDSAVELLT